LSEGWIWTISHLALTSIKWWVNRAFGWAMVWCMIEWSSSCLNLLRQLWVILQLLLLLLKNNLILVWIYVLIRLFAHIWTFDHNSPRQCWVLSIHIRRPSTKISTTFSIYQFALVCHNLCWLMMLLIMWKTSNALRFLGHNIRYFFILNGVILTNTVSHFLHVKLI